MTNIIHESSTIRPTSIKIIEEKKNAKYVCDTELNDIKMVIFYGDEEHPVSKSRYFGIYFSPVDNTAMITDGSFVEQQEFVGAVANNGDIIYSHDRHDYRTSPDESVFIDGGRSYTKTNCPNTVILTVSDGFLDKEIHHWARKKDIKIEDLCEKDYEVFRLEKQILKK
jgi:hypothetical protein